MKSSFIRSTRASRRVSLRSTSPCATAADRVARMFTIGVESGR